MLWFWETDQVLTRQRAMTMYGARTSIIWGRRWMRKGTVGAAKRCCRAPARPWTPPLPSEGAAGPTPPTPLSSRSRMVEAGLVPQDGTFAGCSCSWKRYSGWCNAAAVQHGLGLYESLFRNQLSVCNLRTRCCWESGRGAKEACGLHQSLHR